LVSSHQNTEKAIEGSVQENGQERLEDALVLLTSFKPCSKNLNFLMIFPQALMK
jgi:hypothetical protein